MKKQYVTPDVNMELLRTEDIMSLSVDSLASNKLLAFSYDEILEGSFQQ